MCKENENLFVHQQLISLPSHVHDADAWVGFETTAESGDEHLKAAGVEEIVVAPDFKKERSCVEGFSSACTEKFEDLCFAWREFFGCAGIIETEGVRVDREFTYPVCLRSRSGLIRQYIPKGTDFSELTDEMLAEIEWKLNHRPRKSLG